MHAAARGRLVVNLSATGIVLIPVAIFVLGFATIGNLRELTDALVKQANPASIASVFCILLAAIGLIRRKGVAALPLLIVAPLAMGASWAWLMIRPQPIDSSREQSQEPPSLSVFSRFDGAEVWCNGVLLGETPLKITMAEFDQKVAPAHAPPAQPSTRLYQEQQRPSFGSAEWSAIPGDPHQNVRRDYPHNEDNLVVMKWLAKEKYWWSFRLNGYSVQMTALSFGHSNDNVHSSVDGYWETLQRHADLLRTLAEHEHVDPLTAYAGHIAKWSPPLKQFLKYKPEDVPKHVRPIHFRDHSSDAPLNFTEAVHRRDWRWIARSNDPRSVPLLKLYLQQADDEYHGRVLTFRDDVVATLMESDLPEVESILKERLSKANWPELHLVERFVDRQLARGVSRQEIADWLVKLDMQGADWHLMPLLLNVGGDDFARTAETMPFDQWKHVLEGMRSSRLQPGVRQWLIAEWQTTPHADLMRILNLFPGPDVLEALRNTDLSSTEHTLSLLSILSRSNPEKPERTALSEAAAKALAAATAHEQISALAEVLRRLRTENGLEALLAWNGPDIEAVNRARQEVQQHIDGERQRLAADLKLAHELVDGTKTPDDLVETQAFVWKNGTYESAE